MQHRFDASPAEVAALAARLQPAIDRARDFSAWDFRSIETSNAGAPLPWDYEALARKHARSAHRVLDLGTGGGEVLSRVAEGQKAAFVATEEWHVNAPVARDRLRPIGIPVVRAKSDAGALPFRDGAFDLVLSRHEGVDPADVDRVLAHGGVFLTQQVMPENLPELTRFFPRRRVFPDHFAGYKTAFARLGYAVTRRQHNLRTAYASLGDLVSTLLACAWEIPDINVERDAGALLAVERELSTPEGIVLTEGRYLLEAQKPGT